MHAGIPVNPNSTKQAADEKINRYCHWFALQEKDLNFKAIIRKSQFNNHAITILNPHTNQGLRMTGVRLNRSCSTVRHNPIIKIVIAGVGTPMKESVWRVSKLNLASLMADAKVIINGK